MKTFKGQIDDTWKEVDLTSFLKENPKWNNKTINSYQKTIIEVTECNESDAKEI